ncbi:amino acid ABC transporter permease [Dermacoccus nishinomiyaensis]|uniref:Glutamate ABC transporter permease n=1 Tax=Dermacoccus nishinomiyaensis TaxID=1274 RepID=A0A075JID3_9MICO|nr:MULTISPECIES: amino acid ABC transporter permease [Dermacoccus]HCQ19776.1 amino acid ABC transporter permease [Dermacoccus sp.]AIF41062.1 glutamate ABC transporter permease [Dermacoccus nishinomiyaensis]MBO1757533.1 amino acid ABC transporter permease [Dermacoccus sp. NHGro5]MCG7429622.1 amino acid ABC transporter permease [Dermacoccus nishinomiyaensis]MCT1604151.1 amino acid ABC transporter permease [Dermacoccus nishinomiyaensis]
MSTLFSDYHLLDALWMTIKLTLVAAVGSLVLGTLVAVLRMSPVPMLRFLGTSYINIFRNTPLTLIILSCNLVLWAKLGVELADSKSPDFFTTNNFRLAVLGLTVYHAAYVCEALRSGVNTIPLGQAEAARSIGLTFSQSLREVILPQAFRGAIVPLGNALIALTKNTTVAVVIGVMEMAAMLAKVTEDDPGLLNQAFSASALAFVALTLPTGLLVGYLGKKLAVKR